MAKKFTINVPQTKIDELTARLNVVHFADTPKDAGWSYGTDLDYLKKLTSYWRNSFDWHAAEDDLNKFDHFLADISGINMHFIHHKSTNPEATPLLLIHGWPDSFYRFHKVIPLLTKKFHVVVPSLPGFGFSEKVAMSSGQTANVLASLMCEELGYKQFAVSSSDIGTPVVQALATNHKDVVSFAHLTDTGYPMGAEDFSTMSPEEQAFAAKCQQWWYMEGAYNALQSTKPQTLAFALADSPIGLASWIVEKFNSWSDGGIEKAFTKQEILTNICIYYFTDTISTAIRTYAENTRAMYATGMPKPPAKIEVPTAVASFPADTVPVIEDWAKRNANVVRFTIMPKGGHFAALEQPELFANDIIESIS
jgi:pimeloyl-ACP methyl ester carboxylesterase